jgi:hypothetical protein
MIEKYISKLDYSSLNAEKIKALKLPLDNLHSYLYYDYKKQLHLIIKSEDLLTENRKGIKVINSRLDIVDFGKHSFIDIICLHKDFQKEFIQISEQIIEHFKIYKDLVKAIKIIINKWYYFFEKENNSDLTEEELKGIIGELLFIRNFSSQISCQTIVSAWKGPEKGLRDFNFENFDVEVKTSTKEIGHVHTINGQFQLKSVNIPLFIYSVSLKKSDSGNSFTLKKLIGEICFFCGNDSFLLNDFFEKLEKLNVNINQSENYDHFSYELKNILIVKIDNTNIDNFLLANDNTRISNLKYDFDFNGLKSSEIDIS